MSHSSQKNLFNESAGNAAKKPKKKPATTTVAFRVTDAEKQELDQAAGTMALTMYIRKKLFGDDFEERPARYQKKQKQPHIDHKVIAQLLGTFGQSELARSVLALSVVAQAGNLDVTPEIECKLERACDDIHDIKIALITALNVKSQGGKR